MSTTRRTTLSPIVSVSERAGKEDSRAGPRHRPHEWGGGPRGIVPAAFVVVLLVVATSYEGAFAISRWGPLALLVLAVLLGALIAARGKLARAPSAAVIVLVASIWLLAGWSLLSMVWAQSSGDAFVAGDRMILYAAITTLPFVLPLSFRALVATGWSITLGVGAIALYVLVRLLAHGAPLFLAGRLNGPVDYRNATALLFALAVWPGVIAASARSYRRGIRAGALALATLCLGLAFLTQSRGIVLGLAIGAVPVFVLGPDRSRRAWVAILVVAGVAAASPWLLRPFHAFDGGHGYVSPHTIAVAAWALAILTVAAFAVGLLIALFDNGLRPGSSRMTNTRLVARVALVAIIVAIVCAAGIAIGNPITYAHNKWDQFRSLQSSTPTTTRLGTVGGQRYDLWRVAVDEFDSAPLLGVGADNYSFDYYVERRTNRNLEDPHSLVFALLSELGVVGLGLFLLWLGGTFAAIGSGWRTLPAASKRHAVAPAAAGAVMIGQSAVDWIWLIPGLTAIGLLSLAVAAAQVRAARAPAPEGVGGVEHARSRTLTAIRLAAVGALLAATVLVLAAFLSDAFVQRAWSVTDNPRSELSVAQTAGWLDPWSVTPHYLQASAYETMGERAKAYGQLQDALALEPRNSASLGVLGDFEVRGGDFLAARAFYRRALALNPLDVGLQQLARIGERRSAGG
jgi:hypothetical protein